MDQRDALYEAQQRELAKLPCIKADEARKLRDSEEGLGDALRKASVYIQAAAKKYESAVSVTPDQLGISAGLVPKVVKALQKLGYKAEYHSDQREGGWLDIIW